MTALELDRLVQATLYEGYILFPYRATAAKNRIRWTFGGVFPPNYVGAGGPGELSELRAECLAEVGDGAAVDVDLRFLHPQQRTVWSLDEPMPALTQQVLESHGSPVDHLRLGDTVHRSWQEATEVRLQVASAAVDELAAGRTLKVERTAQRSVEPLSDEGRVAGALVRMQEPLQADVHVATTRISENLVRCSVAVRNTAVLDEAAAGDRERAALQSLASCHLVLDIRGGRWLSLADPPEHALDAAARCANVGLWPTLVGDSDSTVLASPIILDDHPRVAPESPGDLFDSSEIDELLTLTIMSLGPEEKAEMRGADARSRAILERTEGLAQEQLQRLHGTLREPG